MQLGFCRDAAYFVDMQLSFCKDSLKKSLFPTFSLLFHLISLFAVLPKYHSYAS